MYSAFDENLSLVGRRSSREKRRVVWKSKISTFFGTTEISKESATAFTSGLRPKKKRS